MRLDETSRCARSRSSALVAGALLVALALLPDSASAGTALRLDLRGMVAHSERIGVVDVLERHSYREDGRLFTDVTLEFVRNWKGEGPDRVVVRQPGGRVGNIATQVPGVPHFRTGQRALVFLESREGRDAFVVTGLAQGHFHVAYGPGHEHRFAVPDLDGLELVPPENAGDSPETDRTAPGSGSATTLNARTSAPAFQQRATPLTDLRRRVRTIAGDEGADR